MGLSSRAVALVAVIGLVPAIALAQAPANSSTPAPAAPAASADVAPAAPATTGSSSAAPVVPATGYAWRPPASATHPHPTRSARARADTPHAIMPGFETLADGTTRLFVELSKPVVYESKAARGTLTYVLKGAHVDKRNNYNPLVTVHFNTPVTTARLVPHGKDLWFVVGLRAAVQPTVTLDAAKDGAAMLRVEFPKGDYLPGQEPPAPSVELPPGPEPAPSAAPASPPPVKTPAPARPRRKRAPPVLHPSEL